MKSETPAQPAEMLPFIPSALDDFNLPPSVLKMYVHVVRVAGREGVCWQALETMCAHCDLGAATGRAALHALTDLHLLAREGRNGDTNKYRLNPPSLWKPTPYKKHYPLQKRGGDEKTKPPAKKQQGTPHENLEGHPSQISAGHPLQKRGDKGSPLKGIPDEVNPMKGEIPIGKPYGNLGCASVEGYPTLFEWITEMERVGYAHVFGIGGRLEGVRAWMKLDGDGWRVRVGSRTSLVPVKNWHGLLRDRMKSSGGFTIAQEFWPELFRLQREHSRIELVVVAAHAKGLSDLAFCTMETELAPIQKAFNELCARLPTAHSPAPVVRRKPTVERAREIAKCIYPADGAEVLGDEWLKAFGNPRKGWANEDWEKHCAKWVCGEIEGFQARRREAR